MNEIHKQSEKSLQASRRQFLTAAARTGALAVLGALASFVVVKRTRLPREGRCLDPAGQAGCRRCAAYASCSLPKAAARRKKEPSNDTQTR